MDKAERMARLCYNVINAQNGKIQIISGIEKLKDGQHDNVIEGFLTYISEIKGSG